MSNSDEDIRPFADPDDADRSIRIGRGLRASSLPMAVFLLLVGTLVHIPGTASAATLEIVSVVETDGTAPFDGDDLAGHDSSDTNGRVRTNDSISYRIDWNSNDADATGHRVTLTLSVGAYWQAVPDGCLAGSSLSLDRLVLACLTGDHQQGNSGVIRAAALAAPNTLDGTAVSMVASATDDQGGSATADPLDVVVTSVPAMNLRKSLVSARVFNEVSDPTGVVGRVVLWSVSIGPELVSGAPVKGYGPIAPDFTFTDSLTSATPNTRFLDFPVAALGPSNGCGPGSVGPHWFAPYGRIGVVPAATAATSTVDSGTWSCSPSGPQQISVSVTGAVTMPASLPSQNVSGLALDPQSYVISGQIATFTPETDIGDAGGQTTIVNEVSGFDPVGADGVSSNYGPGTEPTSDNTSSVTIRATSDSGSSGGLAFQRPGAGFSAYTAGSYFAGLFAPVGETPYTTIDHWTYDFFGNDHNTFPKGSTLGARRPGNATLRRGDAVNAAVEMTHQGGIGELRTNFQAAVCVQFDSALLRLRPPPTSYPTRLLLGEFDDLTLRTAGFGADIPADINGVAYVESLLEFWTNFDRPTQTNVTDDDTVIIEYGDGGSTDPDIQRSATCQDVDSPGGWHTNPNDLPGGRPSATQIRAHSTVSYDDYPFPQDPSRNQRWRYLQLIVPLEVAPSAPLTVDPASQVHAFMSRGVFRGDFVDWASVTWQPPNYTATNPDDTDAHTSGSNWSTYNGDQLHVVGSTLTVNKTSPLGGTLQPLGATVPWTIEVAVEGDAFGVVVTDALPPELSYVPGSANIAPSSTSPLTWDLGDLTTGTATITFDTMIDTAVAPGTGIVNTAEATATINGAPATTSAFSSVGTRSGSGQFAVVKAVGGDPTVELDSLIEFDLTYTNVGETELEAADMIEVLPFVGDSTGSVQRVPGSDFAGAVTLAGVTPSDRPERILVTVASPATISIDPDDPSNALGAGSIWCELVDTDDTPDVGDPGCPSTLAESTAVRFQQSAPLALGETHTVRVGLTPSGNSADDVYVNNFGGRIGGLVLPVVSNDAVMTVVASSIGDLVWNDYDRDGIQDPGEPGVAGVSVDLRDGSGATIATTTTDDDGLYGFEELLSGDYSIHVTLPAEYVATVSGAGTDPEIDSDIDAAGDGTLFALPIDTDDTSRDAGLYQSASIGDRVWEDLDADGIQDDGEPGIAGVAVELLDDTDDVIASTVTDAAGLYEFDDLPPGSYRVRFVAPTGMEFTQKGVGVDSTVDSDADPVTGLTDVIDLASGERDPSWDTGLYRLAAVGDRVWDDLNGNGIQDDGEPGIGGVVIRLVRDGTEVSTTVSASDGSYLFEGLPPGDYQITFERPTGRSFTASRVGDDATIDSDADVLTGTTPTFTLASGTIDRTRDAGLVVTPDLPDTGSDLEGLLGISALLIIGGTLAALSRRIGARNVSEATNRRSAT